MGNMDLLLMQTAASLIATATTATAERVMTWLRRRLSPDTVDVAEAFATDPQNEKTRENLENLLRRDLSGSASLLAELAALLEEAGVKYGPQTANVTGEGSTVIQIQGNKNLS